MNNKNCTVLELLGDLVELKAYRALDGQAFDFGTGLIENTSEISECVYWKIECDSIESKLEALSYATCTRPHHNRRINAYKLRAKAKVKMCKLHDTVW